MQNTLLEALRAQATFNFVNNDSSNEVRLCLLPGIYSTMAATTDGTTKEPVISYTDKTNLNKAGYNCDQVADDAAFDPLASTKVAVTGVGRVSWRDFLNTVQRVGASVKKMIIQNKTTPYDPALFDGQIEVAKTVLGAKGGTDFITLQNYVSVNAYDRTKIEIDLSGVDELGRSRALELTPEVFLAITVPASASFSIQFQFDTTASAVA
jgi:hypothetical protein